MTRSEQLIPLRPAILSVENKPDMKAAEKFQNEVIRPILKFQHAAFIEVFHNRMSKSKASFLDMGPSLRREKIINAVQKDAGLRNVLIGMVLGLFGEEEIIQYFDDEGEFRKRIVKMICDRIDDHYSRLLDK